MMKTAPVKALFALSVLFVFVACGQQPVQSQEPPRNVSPYLHGNIAQAQDFTRQAFDAMTAAQQANEYDLEGHAANAKNLLFQASEEMKQSALAANHNRRP